MTQETLRQAQADFVIETTGPGFSDITSRVEAWLAAISAERGLVSVYLRHTSASLTIQENADADVQLDLLDALDGLAPRGHGYRHRTEGDDDMPAHIKAMLTSTSLAVPVDRGAMRLGTWQALYLVEHRDAPHQRNVVLHYVGTMDQT